MRRAPVASFTTMGQSKAAYLTERKNYTYKGTKPDLVRTRIKPTPRTPKAAPPPTVTHGNRNGSPSSG